MSGIIGYMLTWGTYGSWLQGDRRGWVKDGAFRGGSRNIERVNSAELLKEAVYLDKKQREIVHEAMTEWARKEGQKILALSVGRCHVHLVLSNRGEHIGELVGRCKIFCRKVLSKHDFCGRLWERGYDKRFCFDEVALQRRIRYVRKHNVI